MTHDSGEHAPLSFPTRGNRKGVLRERFDSEKDSVIESAMKKQESWAKKVGSGASGVMLDDIPALIEALGLKLVDKSKVCVDREVYESFRIIAAAALSAPEKLKWDDE